MPFQYYKTNKNIFRLNDDSLLAHWLYVQERQKYLAVFKSKQRKFNNRNSVITYNGKVFVSYNTKKLKNQQILFFFLKTFKIL